MKPKQHLSLPFLCALLLALAFCSRAQTQEIATSPDNSLAINFDLTESGQLVYSVFLDSTAVINESPMGIVVDGIDFGTGIDSLQNISRSQQTAVVLNGADNPPEEFTYNRGELWINRTDPENYLLRIEYRIYNQAIAFRYEIPDYGARIVTAETTTWNIPTSASLWFRDHRYHNEGIWTNATSTPLDATFPTPALVEFSGSGPLLLLTEANVRRYPTLNFLSYQDSPYLIANHGDLDWTNYGSDFTPWRVVVAGRLLPDLSISKSIVESLSDLSDPLVFPAASASHWIKPGKMISSYWTNPLSSQSYDEQLAFVNYATLFGFDYVYLGPDWKTGFSNQGGNWYEQLQTLQAIASSGSRPIGLWVHESINNLLDPDSRSELLWLYSQAKISGVVIDLSGYEDAGTQETTEALEDIYRTIGNFLIQVAITGSRCYTGQAITHPNLMAVDGTLGLDEALLANNYQISPQQNAIIPFTRGLLGPVFSPTLSLDAARRGPTTTMHQLASIGTVESPLLSIWESPLALIFRDVVRKALRAIPNEWDESVILPESALADFTAIARRNGDKWYLFVQNGTSLSRSKSLGLNFLGSGAYDLVQYFDSDAENVYRSNAYNLDPDDTLNLDLLPGGGYIGIFDPRPTEDREFLMGFDRQDTPLPNSLDADIVRIDITSSIPWTEAANETGYATYPSELLESWASLKSELSPEQQLYLVVSPFDGGSYQKLALNWGNAPDQPLQSPWSEYAFHSPTVKAAYSNYLKAAIAYFEPEYLSILPDANRGLTENASKWESIKALVYATQTSLATANTKLVTSLNYESLIGATSQSAQLLTLYQESYPNILTAEPAQILAGTELIAFSVFPSIAENEEPLRDYLSIALDFSQDNELPITIDRIALPSVSYSNDPESPDFSTSEGEQFSALNQLLELAYNRRFPFIIYGQAQDSAPTQNAHGMDALPAISGLLKQNGSSKPSLGIWQSFQTVDYLDVDDFEHHTDTDGDGIVDAEDSAPNNANVSSTHYYFEDADKDLFGNSSVIIATESEVPPPSTAPWRGDPDDRAKLLTPSYQQKGNRHFSVGVWTDEEAMLQHQTYHQELGADTIQLEISWENIESEMGVYEGSDVARLDTVARYCRKYGLSLSLTLSLIDGESLTVPEELSAALSFQVVPWTNEFVEPRFKDALAFVLDRVDGVRIESIQFAKNAQAYQPDSDATAFWTSFGSLLSNVDQYLETASKSPPPIGIRVDANSILNPNSINSGLLETVFALDFVGIDYRVVNESGNIIEPITIVGELAQLFSNLNGKSCRFYNLSYPSGTELLSSQTKQSQFILALFEIWDAVAEQSPFIGFRALVDSEQNNRSDGFLSSKTEYKRAFHTLRTQTMNRGWWKLPRINQRSFYLGFTNTPFDNGANFEEIEEIDNWHWQRIATDSDIVNLQLDGGIPWNEALNDDFSSDSPPFSSFIMGFWEKLRRSIPENHKIVVSFSPTGNPRSRLEAYWGYGRGISYVDDDGFITEPVGDPLETIDAFLPFPWDKLRFNDEPVKTAFFNYTKRVVQFFEPDYIVIGLEASESIPEDPVRFDEYIELQTFLYQALKEDPLTKDIPIVVSVSSTSLITDEYGVPYKFDQQPNREREEQIDGLKRLLPITDIIGISHYPHFGKFNAEMIPSNIYESLFSLLKEIGAEDKPVAITESGYTADPYTIFDTKFDGTVEKQDLYMKHMLYEMEKASNPVSFIINYEIRDTDYTWLRQKEQADQGLFNPVFLQFFQYFRDIGIYDGDGLNSRPIYYTWTQALSQPVLPKGSIIVEDFDIEALLKSELTVVDGEHWLTLRYRLQEAPFSLNYKLEWTDSAFIWNNLELNDTSVFEEIIPASESDDFVDVVETHINLGILEPKTYFRLVVSKSE